MKASRAACGAPLAALLLLLPFLAGDFYINLASQILIAAIFALSLNLLVGFGGMTSLGHASYLGVAAYISALLTSRYGWGHGAAALFSIAGTTVTAHAVTCSASSERVAPAAISCASVATAPCAAAIA